MSPRNEVQRADQGLAVEGDQGFPTPQDSSIVKVPSGPPCLGKIFTVLPWCWCHGFTGSFYEFKMTHIWEVSTIQPNRGSGCFGGDSLVLVQVPRTGTDMGDAIQHIYRAVHEVFAGDAVLCEGGVYLPVESTRRVPVDPAVVSSGVLPMVSVGGVTLTYDHPVNIVRL